MALTIPHNQRDIDLEGTINIDGYLLPFFTSIKFDGGKPRTWKATPVGGLPALDWDTTKNSRTPISFTITTPVTGKDSSEWATFQVRLAQFQTYDCVAASATDGQISIPNYVPAQGRKFMIMEAYPNTDISDGDGEEGNLTTMDVVFMEVGAAG